MIEERVMVCSPAESRDGLRGVWVQGIQQSACNACSAKSSCGSHSLSKLGRTVKLWLVTDQTLAINEEVIIGLPEGALAKSALMLYGLPLMGLMLFAMLGEKLGMMLFGSAALGSASGDGGAIIFGLLGLFIGFVLARVYSIAHQRNFQPSLIQKCNISFTAID